MRTREWGVRGQHPASGALALAQSALLVSEMGVVNAETNRHANVIGRPTEEQAATREGPVKRGILALVLGIVLVSLVPATAYAGYSASGYTDNVKMTANVTYGNQARIAVLNPYVYPASWKVECLGATRTDATAWVEVGWCKYGTSWAGQEPQVPTMFFAYYNNGYYDDFDVQTVPVGSVYYYAMRYVGVDAYGRSTWYFYLNDVNKGTVWIPSGRLSSSWAISQSETHYQEGTTQYDDAKGHFYGMTYYDGSTWRPWNSLSSNVDSNPLYYVKKVSNTEWWNLHP